MKIENVYRDISNNLEMGKTSKATLIFCLFCQMRIITSSNVSINIKDYVISESISGLYEGIRAIELYIIQRQKRVDLSH